MWVMSQVRSMEPDLTLAAVYQAAANLTEQDKEIFAEAVKTAFSVCSSAAPSARLRMIETPTQNFMFVTSVIPSGVTSGEKKTKLNIDAALDNLALSFANKKSKKMARTYLLQNVLRTQDQQVAISGKYILYTKKHIETSLMIDKTKLVKKILEYAETPNLLGYTDVRDLECLLWLVFCGPKSFCQSDSCFGYSKTGYNAAFPNLLPPYLYECGQNNGLFFGIVQAYVFSWYSDFDFSVLEISERARRRIRSLLYDLKQKFAEQEVSVLPVASQMCIFCALYKQNKLSLEYVSGDLKTSVFSPIIIKDCLCAQTTISTTQMLPGTKSSAIFPVYDLRKLLGALVISEGSVKFDI
uniref:U67 n=3 Tax=root TaxID=1 RepID=A0A126LB00_HUMAN|nr:protein UL95 [Human betaherpesvirus 6A]AMD82197.1 U67 [Homo sapiens]APO38536.1 protein UL95 [Human betaherpesvirus 6A]APO39045.1 protein UL95 [Human betaherpesvirus 6A]APO39125.1 protein UL95 [Human betaherpesvirus 6A]